MGGFAAGFAAVHVIVIALVPARRAKKAQELLCQELPPSGEGPSALAAENCGFNSWGAGRFPFVVLYRRGGTSGGIDEDLLAYLQAPIQGWESWGLVQRGRNFDNPVWKLDWHAIPGLPDVAPVFVPRPDKPVDMALRAPAPIFAFIEAFREANSEAFEGLAADLEALAATAEGAWNSPALPWASSSWLPRAFAGFIRSKRHFGVIEMQIYYGEQVFVGGAHNDGTTSALHLSITLSGQRTVRAKVETAGAEPRWEDREMYPGDIYLSSPSFYVHQVNYRPAPHEAPMIALHCRFAYPPELAFHLNQRWDAPVLAVAQTVARRLRSLEGSLRLPSLEAVKAAEARCCPS